MTLEQQVCNLEQAKKLKELGVKQESCFWWVGKEVEKHKHDPLKLMYSVDRAAIQSTWQLLGLKGGYEREQYSAFTVSELGEMLPPFFPSFVHDSGHTHCKNVRVDTFPIIDGETSELDIKTNIPAHVINKELIPIQDGRTEAQARAKMLIFLLENKLISL